jgi:hypothetical protein
MSADFRHEPVNKRTPVPLEFSISFVETSIKQPLDGRLLLLLSVDSTKEPCYQITDGPSSQLVFGMDVEALKPNAEVNSECESIWVSN